MTAPRQAINNPEELERRKQELDVERRNREKDLISVMETVEGRRVMWRILGKTKMFQSRFIEKSLQMYWIEGRRALGLELFEELTTVCPELFWKMQAENIEKPETNEVDNG